MEQGEEHQECQKYLLNLMQKRLQEIPSAAIDTWGSSGIASPTIQPRLRFLFLLHVHIFVPYFFFLGASATGLSLSERRVGAGCFPEAVCQCQRQRADC